MKFIARYLNVIGLLLLASFVTAAAGLYLQVPERLQSQRAQSPSTKGATPTAPHKDGCCGEKPVTPEPPSQVACPHLAAPAAKASSCCPQPANP